MLVLVVEDDDEMREALASSFHKEGFAVDACSDGESAFYKNAEHSYDLIVLDVGLPGVSGREVCRQLRLRAVLAPIIVLSVENEVATKIELLALGADDYLTKPFLFGELLARARALFRRPHGIRGDIFFIGDVVLDTATKHVTSSKRDIHLTPKEFSLLEYLMRNDGVVISRQELLEHVWDINADPFTNTVETHISSLRRKLGGAREQLIHTVSGTGYKVE